MTSAGYMSLAILFVLAGAIVQHIFMGNKATPMTDLIVVILFIAQRAFVEWENYNKKKGS